jgi:phage FluMu gp28-like protein
LDFLSPRQIQSFRVRFGSGFRITALSSRPENIHGLQGVVDLDEAALHKNVRAVLESATALLIWGGKIRVWSTHRGKRNPFNELLTDVRAGRYGARARAIRITFDDAVANGLYERACAMQGKAVTADGKREWYTAIRAAYGPRTAAMREELDAIPRDGSGTAIPTVWIERAMPEVRPVLRIVFPDDCTHQSEGAREAWCAVWIAAHLRPVLDPLCRPQQPGAAPGPGARWAVGMDFARHRHFTVIVPALLSQELRRDAPFIVELANAPARQQEQILWTLLEALPRGRWTFAGDATGPGQTLMEYTGDRYGRAALDAKTGRYSGGPIHEIVLSRAWYAEHMGRYLQLFEDGYLTLPRDASLEDDHRAVEYVDGIPMVPKLERKDLKDPDLIRHGDGAIAGCLMEFAASHPASGPIEWESVPRGTRADPARAFDDPLAADDDDRRGLY